MSGVRSSCVTRAMTSVFICCNSRCFVISERDATIPTTASRPRSASFSQTGDKRKMKCRGEEPPSVISRSTVDRSTNSLSNVSDIVFSGWSKRPRRLLPSNERCLFPRMSAARRFTNTICPPVPATSKPSPTERRDLSTNIESERSR